MSEKRRALPSVARRLCPPAFEMSRRDCRAGRFLENEEALLLIFRFVGQKSREREREREGERDLPASSLQELRALLCLSSSWLVPLALTATTRRRNAYTSRTHVHAIPAAPRKALQQQVTWQAGRDEKLYEEPRCTPWTSSLKP